MLPLYVGCLGFGSVLVAVAVLGGHDAHHGGEPPIDGHVDLDGDPGATSPAEHALETLASPLADAAHVAEAAHDTASDIVGSLWVFTSLRFWSFGLLAFGATGTLAACAGSNWHLPLSIGLGLVVGAFAAFAFRRLGREHVSGLVDPTGLAGRTGRIVIPVRPGQTGKVAVHTDAARHELPARSQGGETFETGATVHVVAVRGGVATVAPPGSSPSPRGR